MNQEGETTGLRPSMRLMIIIGVVVVIIAIPVGYLLVSRQVCFARQRSRVEELSADLGQAPVATKPGARSRPAGEPRLDGDLPLSRLRLIASHNSYHQAPDPLRLFLIGLAAKDQAETLRYSHPPLWEQLETGIRSFELDVRPRSTRFTITHVPLVDDLGPHPDFSLALREIDLWSSRHPGHVPIIVILELKSDWTVLDPGLVEWDSATLDRLDATIREAIPAERLYTPQDLTAGTRTIAEARTAGEPRLDALFGRTIVVMHTNPALDSLYIAEDATLAGRAMFTSSGPEPREDALFVIHNTPSEASIARLTEAGFVVRTRADADLNGDREQRRAASESTASIVSTDYPPGHANGTTVKPVTFLDGSTITITSPSAGKGTTTAGSQ